MLFRVLGEEEKIRTGANLMAVLLPADLQALPNGNTASINVFPPNQSVIAFPEGGTNPGIPSGTTIQLGIGNKVQLVAMQVLPAGAQALSQPVSGPFTFSDAAITSCTISLGDQAQTGGANTTRYLAATEVSAPGSYVPYSQGTGTTFTLLTADQLNVTLTGTAGHNLNTCTGGGVALYLKAEDLTQLPTS